MIQEKYSLKQDDICLIHVAALIKIKAVFYTLKIDKIYASPRVFVKNYNA